MTDYELIDSGGGRKLERFGRYTLDRPAAQAAWRPRKDAGAWGGANASFDRENGNRWRRRETLPPQWTIRIDGMTLKLSATDFGHLGVFPEQRESWRWIGERIESAAARRAGAEPPRVLNLFAYSGAATLAAARAGATVCHLDASRGMVTWARENAALNGLDAHPIRWIVEDCHKFLHREIRRGRRYEGIILDPPSFGRGQAGELYKIEADLPDTLELCRRLLSDDPLFVLLSAHTPGFTPRVLENLLAQTLGGVGGATEGGEMLLTGGAEVFPLPSGAWARWRSAEADGRAGNPDRSGRR